MTCGLMSWKELGLDDCLRRFHGDDFDKGGDADGLGHKERPCCRRGLRRMCFHVLDQASIQRVQCRDGGRFGANLGISHIQSRIYGVIGSVVGCGGCETSTRIVKVISRKTHEALETVVRAHSVVFKRRVVAKRSV